MRTAHRHASRHVGAVAFAELLDVLRITAAVVHAHGAGTNCGQGGRESLIVFGRDCCFARTATACLRPTASASTCTLCWKGDLVGLDFATLFTAVITAVGATWLERVRWRRAEAAGARNRELATKRALRLVERELNEAETRIARIVGRGCFAPADRTFATNEWNEHRGWLAGELGVADWHQVTAAYDSIVDLNEALDQRLGALAHTTAENLGQVLTSAVAEAGLSRVRDDDQLELRWRAVRTASWILRAYAGEAEEAHWALEQDRLLARQLWPREAKGSPRIEASIPSSVGRGRARGLPRRLGAADRPDAR